MKDILSEIIANKRFEVDLQKQAISIEQLQEGISESPTPRSMKQALASSTSGIIAEFKRRSPSKGWIQEEVRPEEIVPSELLYDLNGFTNANHECNLRDSSHLISGEPVEWQPSYVSFEEYAHSFETVARHIHAGNSYLVNLTCATPVHANLSLKDIFYQSKAMYKLWMRDRFVVFSPEIFVRTRDGLIYS